MCGIVYCESFNGDPVNKLVALQFQKQRNRGTEGFGFYDRVSGRLHRATKERKILSKLRNHSSSSVLFHHRYPTSTDNVRNACHPFSTMRYFDTNYVLVHNGWITNADELKKEHEALGIVYYSTQVDGRFNDSEALLWDVALYLEGKQDKLKAEGAIAFICIAKSDNSDKVYFARNNNPLNMLLSDNVLMLSSEGAGSAIDSHTLYEFDYTTGELQDKPLNVPSYSYTYTSPQHLTGFTARNSTWAYDEEEDELYRLGGAPLIMEDEEDIIADIKRTYRSYASDAQGNYEHCYQMLQDDIWAMEEQAKVEQAEWGVYPDDLRYQVDIAQAVCNMLFEDENWQDSNSTMPEYVGRVLPLGV